VAVGGEEGSPCNALGRKMEEIAARRHGHI
jgi:hypothetical protein